ncbi:MAG: hypothetical protein ABJF01_17295 [bacterium]
MSIVLLLPVAFAPDVVEGVFAAFGDHNRVLSHSLVSVAIGATLVAIAYGVRHRQTGAMSEALVLWFLYVSHWPADFITGIKPTWPGGPEVGLLLYDHAVADALLESVIVVICWLVLRRAAVHVRTGSFAAAVDRRLVTAVVPIFLIAAQITFDVIQGHLLP